MILGTITGLFVVSSCRSSSNADALDAKKDSTGMPGDQFSLAGALQLFKNAKNLKDFEKSLNSKENIVNNLDLNQDGKTDYIRVVDLAKENAHAVVMQVPINANEFQDVAVIQIEKKGSERAVAQIVGNGLLYGDSAVYAPTDQDKSSVAKAGLLQVFSPAVATVEVNVMLWPPVSLMFAPEYVPYVSPVAFGVYPVWYEPWPPRPWGWYHAKSKKYKSVYVPVYTPGLVIAHGLYLGNARFSPFVIEKHPIILKHNGPKMKMWTRNGGSQGPSPSAWKGKKSGGNESKSFKGGFEKGGTPNKQGKPTYQGNKNQKASGANPKGGAKGGGSSKGKGSK